MLLLDTSILIELFRKTEKKNSFFYQLAQSREDFSISSITKYEIDVGTTKVTDFLFWKNLYQAIQVISFDENAANEATQIYKELKSKSQLIAFPDIAIAATARINNFELATLNIKHFNRIDNLKIATIS